MIGRPVSALLLLFFLTSGEMAAFADEPVLTIVTADGEKLYDRAALEALPQSRIRTHTSVTDGLQQFTGPLMRDLLADAGFQSAEVRALALNDYEVVIPLSDFERFDVIAALSMNGHDLTPRDKGPVWIVYPRDDDAVLQDIRYDYRWVWQLTRLEAP
ncbi:molybdopterin-dependent oxidoreductase [Martelella limonii]|uniref:molybdopterin-dependent oxidoreductase n=1 Tax=Martelella limonii TaxID=1647649 RepID=UPI0015806610|nr:molybdopterin-dependent oxidoreductase [Martelella limonii]